MTRRLIEQAFPLHKVSEDSRHEKNVRHGHISTLHIWPARRPLAACRAATFAALIPDPGEPDKLPDNGPGPWLSPALRAQYRDLAEGAKDPDEQRRALCRLIEGFTRWGSESGPQVEQARELIRLAYNGRPPRVMDPFAGGGAIPLEAMRLTDQLHRLLRHWDAGDTAGLTDYMQRTGLGQNDLFWSVAQAMVEMSEAQSRERALLEAVVAWGRGRTPEPGAAGPVQGELFGLD